MSFEPTDPATDSRWKPNQGQRPPGAKGKRVRIWLNCGREASYSDNPMSPPGWAADTTKWALDPQFSYGVAFYQVIGA